MNQLRLIDRDRQMLDTIGNAPGVLIWRALAEKVLASLPECEFDLIVCPAWREGLADGDRTGHQVPTPNYYAGTLLVAVKGDSMIEAHIPDMGEYLANVDERLPAYLDSIRLRLGAMTHVLNRQQRRAAVRNN